VIGSVHTRYGMNAEQMTNRVLKALDDPHLTILGHPTGRLLLTREPYAIDLGAIIEKAGRVGVAIELNADPHRLGLAFQDMDVRLAEATGLPKQGALVVEVAPGSPAEEAGLRRGMAIVELKHLRSPWMVLLSVWR
jgi:DNA polymerase (family 10)